MDADGTNPGIQGEASDPLALLREQCIELARLNQEILLTPAVREWFRRERVYIDARKTQLKDAIRKLEVRIDEFENELDKLSDSPVDWPTEAMGG